MQPSFSIDRNNFYYCYLIIEKDNSINNHKIFLLDYFSNFLELIPAFAKKVFKLR